MSEVLKNPFQDKFEIQLRNIIAQENIGFEHESRKNTLERTLAGYAIQLISKESDYRLGITLEITYPCKFTITQLFHKVTLSENVGIIDSESSNFIECKASETTSRLAEMIETFRKHIEFISKWDDSKKVFEF